MIEPAGPTQKKTSMKATPSQTSSSVQSNSDSGGDDSSKENKENGSASENGQRTPKKKGLAFLCFFCFNLLYTRNLYMATLANSADPNKMPYNMVLYQGPHCLLKKYNLQGL